MDIGVLNSLGYIEIIEISIWLGVMYYGKCWIDYKFKQRDMEITIIIIGTFAFILGYRYINYLREYMNIRFGIKEKNNGSK